MTELTQTLAEQIAGMVLSAVAREYPNKILHALSSDADVAPPRELTPAFFGCYDWHSAVHGHWTLVRLIRTFPTAPFASPARAALERSLSATKLEGERRYLEHPDHASFEVPYGMGWLLTLHRELCEWEDADARRWCALLAPLAELAGQRVLGYLSRLPFPVRSGEHSQTAFGAALFLDWAHGTGQSERARLAGERVRALYATDSAGPLHLEPSGYDFLSPCLAEADLLRRILPPPAFAAWLGGFLPGIPLDGGDAWLPVGVVTDPSDGKLAHLDGLNLSRAWMLEGIAGGLPPADPRVAALRAAAATHARSGVASVTGAHYEGGHWLGSFATYLLTARGRGTAGTPAASGAAQPAP